MSKGVLYEYVKFIFENENVQNEGSFTSLLNMYSEVRKAFLCLRLFFVCRNVTVASQKPHSVLCQ
jgi:hypothetical protein